MLASGSFSGEIKLWDIETSTAIATFDINPYHIINMCFSADGTKMKRLPRNCLKSSDGLNSACAHMGWHETTPAVRHSARSDENAVMEPPRESC